VKFFTTDPRFKTALLNTFAYVAIKTSFTVTIGILIALLLNQVGRLQRLYIYFLFLPVLCSASAIGILFLYLYQPTFGLLNTLLRMVGLPPQCFIINPKQALYCVVAADIWQTIGFSTLIFFTALMDLPEVFLDAAKIDGAGPVRTFFSITLPLLGHAFLFIVVYTMINAFQVFDFIFVMTSTGGGTGGAAGGPGYSTYVLSLIVYNEGMLRLQVDKAAAAGVIMFFIILVLSIFQLKILRPKWEY
jgi:ABC-type sugar transport system permease subunit